MKSSPHILIIGQGIAGTLLAWSLLQRGARVQVADGGLPGASSVAAAGIINPVTGKRFVKSWRFEAFFPVARQTYAQMEQALGLRIWEEKPIVRLLATAEEANDWSLRCGMPDYAEYLGELSDGGGWSPFVRPDFRFGAIRRAARVHFGPLLSAFRQHLRTRGLLTEQAVEASEAGVEALLRQYDRVVFCEGYRSAHNLCFPGLPWQIAKGEALILRFADPDAARLTEMLKKTVTLVPLGDGTCWAGGSYQWHYPDLNPSAGERDYLLAHLRGMLAAPFEVVGQVAGIRPTVRDRRPLLGESPLRRNVFLFNGLGTKGALMAPYWAEHMAAHLLEGLPLDAEVALSRT